MTIRKAAVRDAASLVAFNQAMALETEGKRLDPAILGPGVERLLATPEYGFYTVAEIDGVVVGGLMITYEWSDWRNGLFWWVQSVYVLPAFRGRGVYRSLYEFVKAEAAGRACGFRLYVEEHNEAAQAVYRRLGMEKTHYLMFEEMT